MKKWLAFVLALLMIPVSCFAVVNDGYRYEYLEDGTVQLNGISFKRVKGQQIIIPERIEGRKVTSIYPQLSFGIDTNEVRSEKPVVKTIILPDSIEFFRGGEFGTFYDLTEILVSSENPYFESVNGVLFSKSDKRLVCYPAGITDKSYIIPDGTQTISYHAFKARELTQVTIPESITHIEQAAFYKCNALTELSIPNSVSSMERPWTDCESLKNVIISPDSPYFEVVDGAIYNKIDKTLVTSPPGWSEQSYVIPDGVASIGAHAFEGCEFLKEISIPDGVASIGDYAFGDCESLKEISIPDSVTSIGEGAFFKCKSLKDLMIPDSVTSIGLGAFSSCESLKTLKIPDGVTSIEDNVFSVCKALEEITIPESVTSIGIMAFFFCDALEEITIPESVTSIGGMAFAYCKALEKITIPESVTSIGASAFSHCESLKEIKIPEGVTSIGEDVFKDSPLVTVKLTSGSYAEQYCKENNIKYEVVDSGN